MTLAATLTAVTPLAERTLAFHFTRPPGFDFEAGQAVELLLEQAAGAAPLGHAFSLVSAPHEGELVVATRMRDSTFKQALARLAPGASVQLDGPFGSLTLPRDTRRPVVLVAGGIGITPFMSMLRQAAAQGATRPLALVYSNRRPEDAAFLAELQRLAAAAPGFRLHVTMTGLSRSRQAWTGAQGRIDAATLQDIAAAGPAPAWYVAGPPGLVQGVRATLDAMGVDEFDVGAEEFSGY